MRYWLSMCCMCAQGFNSKLRASGCDLSTDLFFSDCMDGGSPALECAESLCVSAKIFKKKVGSQWFLVMVIWNFPPWMRTKREYMIPWGILPQGIATSDFPLYYQPFQGMYWLSLCCMRACHVSLHHMHSAYSLAIHALIS